MEVKSGLRQPRQQTFPRRYFLSRTSRSMRSATVQYRYLYKMAPPQTGPKKSSRRSRKARTEGINIFNNLKLLKAPTNLQQSLRPQNRLQTQTVKALSQARSPDILPRLHQRKPEKVSALRQRKKHHLRSKPQEQTTSRLSNRFTSVRLPRSSPMISTS